MYEEENKMKYLKLDLNLIVLIRSEHWYGIEVNKGEWCRQTRLRTIHFYTQ